MPGGRESPSVSDCIFSAAARSALALASAKAAMMTSSSISLSDGVNSEGSMRTPLSSPLAFKVTPTMPPPDAPSTSRRPSSSCASCSLACMACACFIMPMISIAGLSLTSKIVVAQRLEIGIADVVVGLRLWGRRGGRAVGHPHVDHPSALEPFQHLAHKRMRLSAARALGLARIRPLAQRRRGRARRQRHHPALAGPFLQASRQSLGEARRRALDQRERNAALLESLDPRVLLQRLDELNVALQAGERDHLLEARETDRRTGSAAFAGAGR